MLFQIFKENLIMQKKVLVVTGWLLAGSLAYADDFKLGYVDVAKIFTTAKPAIALQQALKDKFSPQQKSLQAMNDNLLTEQQQIDGIEKKAPSMDKLSPADRTKLQTLGVQYQKDQAQFQQQYQVYQQKFQRNQEYASALVLGRANTILKDISDKGGYDLVLTSNQLVYAKPKYDLTDQVIAQLNKVDGSSLVKQLGNADNPQLSPAALNQLAAPQAAPQTAATK